MQASKQEGEREVVMLRGPRLSPTPGSDYGVAPSAPISTRPATKQAGERGNHVLNEVFHVEAVHPGGEMRC